MDTIIHPLPKEELHEYWYGRKVLICPHDGSVLRKSSGMKNHGGTPIIDKPALVIGVCSLSAWISGDHKHAIQNFGDPKEACLLTVKFLGVPSCRFFGWEVVPV